MLSVDVTCILSHVMCQMSHVRCHISDVTRHVSPVANAIVICWQAGNFIFLSMLNVLGILGEKRYMLKEDAKVCEMRGIACEISKCFVGIFIPYI